MTDRFKQVTPTHHQMYHMIHLEKICRHIHAGHVFTRI